MKRGAPTKSAGRPKKGGRAGGAHNALKAPKEGDERARLDLELQRELLLKRLRSTKISPRDLSTISAELRKVNHSLAIVDGASRQGGIAEEDLAQRAATVRDRLRKTLAERDRLRVAVAEATAAEDPDEEPPADVGT